MNKVVIKPLNQPTRFVLGRLVTAEGITLDLDELDDAERAGLEATQGISVEPVDGAGEHAPKAPAKSKK